MKKKNLIILLIILINLTNAIALKTIIETKKVEPITIPTKTETKILLEEPEPKPNYPIEPLTKYSDKQYQGNNQWKLTLYNTPKYYDSPTGLTLIDTNITTSTNEWNYQVTKGIHQLYIKEDGTFKFQFEGQWISLKIKGIGFYNTNTKEKITKTGITLNNPTITKNQITWQLPLDSNYTIIYNNTKLQDIIWLSEDVKTFLKNNKPTDWNKDNTYFGLIYDMNIPENSLIESTEFETTNTIKFLLPTQESLFSIRNAIATHQDWNSHYLDANNEGLYWQRIRYYKNGTFIDATPITALDTSEGGIKFNATIQVDINLSADDCDQDGATLDLTDTAIYLRNTAGASEDWMGIRFQNINFNSDDDISEVILKMKGGRACGAGLVRCDATIFGENSNDPTTWTSGFPTHKPADANLTDNSTDFSFTDSFTPNGSYDDYDYNVTNIFIELINAPTWAKGEDMAYVIRKDYMGVGKYISVYSYDHASYPAPQLEITYSGEPPPTEWACEPFATHQWKLEENCYYDSNSQNIGDNELYIDFNGFIGLNDSNISSNQITIAWRWREFTTQAEDLNALNTFIGYSTDYMIWNYPDKRHSGNIWFGAYPMIEDTEWTEINFQDGNEYYIGDVSFGMCTGYGRPTDLNIMYWNTKTGWNTALDDDNFTEEECDWNGYYVGTGCSFWCDVNAGINDYAQRIRLSWDLNGQIAGQQGDLNWTGVSEIIARGKDNHWNTMTAITTTNNSKIIVIN